MYNPPSLIGGKDKPYCSGGGLRDNQNNVLIKRAKSKLTCWSIPNPTRKNQTIPRYMDTTPNIPKWIGPSCAFPI